MLLGLKLTRLFLNQIRVSLESDFSSEENLIYYYKLETQLHLVQRLVSTARYNITDKFIDVLQETG